MAIELPELTNMLSEAFDAGAQSPFEMIDQQIERILRQYKKVIVSTSSADMHWGDYIRAIKNPDPWVVSTQM
jgi:hypothetical protein